MTEQIQTQYTERMNPFQGVSFFYTKHTDREISCEITITNCPTGCFMLELTPPAINNYHLNEIKEEIHPSTQSVVVTAVYTTTDWKHYVGEA